MGINQKGPTGAFEPRVLKQGGFNTELGNANSVRIKKMGDGRKNYGGVVQQFGASEREYVNPAMDDLDRYYGYGKGQR